MCCILTLSPTFDDWDQNHALYQALSGIDPPAFSKYKVGVSIPVNYEEPFLEAIYALSDRVYLMAYEHKDVDYIERKTNDAFWAWKDGFVHPFKDFNDRYELELFCQTLDKRFNNPRIALHDMKTMMQLEEKNHKCQCGLPILNEGTIPSRSCGRSVPISVKVNWDRLLYLSILILGLAYISSIPSVWWPP